MVNKKKEEKKVNKYLFLLVVIAIAALAILLFALSRISDIEVINFDVKVGDYVGFNLDKDKLHFGTVTPSGYAFRDVYVTSSEKVKVVAKTFGVGFMDYDKNYFILEPGKKELVRITARVPQNTRFGIYNGFVLLLFLKVN